MRLCTENHTTKASCALTCIFEQESCTCHVGHSHISQVRSSKKTSKSHFVFWLGGVQKTMCLIYRFFLLNSPLPHLSLHHNSLSHLAGKSRLFFFAEWALILHIPSISLNPLFIALVVIKCVMCTSIQVVCTPKPPLCALKSCQNRLRSPSFRLRLVLQQCYAYGLLLTCTKSTYRLITILAVYENGPGLSWDNPLCLLFILPCSLFASRLMYCTEASNG